MATKNQHYVPQVYIKAWENTVYSLSEPSKAFRGVYLFERKKLSIGNGRNKDGVLANNHTYTIKYDLFILLKNLPKVRAEFVTKLKGLLDERNVIAYSNAVKLTKSKEYIVNLDNIDNWDFYYLNGTVAKKTAIINSIKAISCYCL